MRHFLPRKCFYFGYFKLIFLIIVVLIQRSFTCNDVVLLLLLWYTQVLFTWLQNCNIWIIYRLFTALSNLLISSCLLQKLKYQGKSKGNSKSLYESVNFQTVVCVVFFQYFFFNSMPCLCWSHSFFWSLLAFPGSILACITNRGRSDHICLQAGTWLCCWRWQRGHSLFCTRGKQWIHGAVAPFPGYSTHNHLLLLYYRLLLPQGTIWALTFAGWE